MYMCTPPCVRTRNHNGQCHCKHHRTPKNVLRAKAEQRVFGPLQMPDASAGGGSLGTDAVREEGERAHAASASSARSLLERFTWRVQLPVGDHRMIDRMILDGTQVRLGAT